MQLFTGGKFSNDNTTCHTNMIHNFHCYISNNLNSKPDFFVLINKVWQNTDG